MPAAAAGLSRYNDGGESKANMRKLASDVLQPILSGRRFSRQTSIFADVGERRFSLIAANFNCSWLLWDVFTFLYLLRGIIN